jgi:uncharacterized protein (TIGR00255 family)
MIESMTGFGRGLAEGDGLQVRVELRAVNSRFYEAQVRLGAGLQPLEAAVRERLQSRLSRGKVAAQVELARTATAADSPVLDEAAARGYAAQLRRLKEIAGLEGQPDWSTWVRLPGLFITGTAAADQERLTELAMAAVDQALEEFAAMRAAEGGALERDLRARIAAIGVCLDQIEQLAAQQGERIRTRLRERLAALLQPGQVPEERLALEVVLVAERCDITEEIVRFRSHNAQFLAAMDGGGEVGRRLGFLLQEMNREANTINSKANETQILHLAVGVKEEVEKLREQVQNLV